MHTFFFLLLLVSTVLCCEPGEYNASLIKHSISWPYQESFQVWKGAKDSGEKIVDVSGADDDYDSYNTVNFCLQPTGYTLVLLDSTGDGWGDESSTPDLALFIENMLVMKVTIPYVSNGNVPYRTFAFNPTMLVALSTSWKYTDSPQENNNWKLSSYDDSNWQTATSGSMPDYTSITRYYRFQTVISSLTAFNTLETTLNTGEAVVFYVNGHEIYRHKLPNGDITSTTLAQLTTDAIINPKSASISKFYLTSGSNVFSIEIHRADLTGSATDTFNFGALVSGDGIVNECTTSLLAYGEPSSPQAGTSYNKKPSNLFDGAFDSVFYSSTTKLMEVTYVTKNDFYFNLNSYSFTTAFTSSYGLPKEWKIFGSNNGDDWTLLDYKANRVLSASQTYTYSLISNTRSFRMYKLNILDSTAASKVALSLFEGFHCNYESIPVGLQYPNSRVEKYALVDTIDIQPLSTGFYNYEVVPNLPNGLTLDASTGSITGIATEHVTETAYSITAISGNDNTSYTYVLTLNLLTCSLPGHVALRFRKINKYSATQEAFSVISSTGVVLYHSSQFTDNVDVTVGMCAVPDEFTVTLTDSANDGWRSGSILYVEMLNNDVDMDYIILGAIYNYINGVNDYHFDTRSLIYSRSSGWLYLQGQIPSDWTKQTSTTTFNDYQFATPISTTSNIWLFKKIFTVTDINSMNSIEIRIKIRAGFVLYINEIEYYRKNLPTGSITTSTTPIAGEDESYYFTLSLSANVLQNGNNVIAIAIINLPSNNPTSLLFDSSIQIIPESAIGRSWDLSLTATPTGSNLSGLTDMNPSSQWTVTSPATQPVELIYNFGNTHAEYMNRVCITSNYNLKNNDPSDWTLYGSNNGSEWELLSNVTNAYFSERSQIRCYYIPSNTHAWQYYRFLFSEPAIHTTDEYTYSIGDITFLMVDLDNIVVTPLSFSSDAYFGYVNIPFPETTSSSSVWSNYRISPSLPTPLELDTATGSIRGIPTSPLTQGDYTITASNPKGIDSSVIVKLSVTYCAPPNIMFYLLIRSDSKGSEQSVIFKDKTGKELLNQSGFVNDQDNYFPFCSNPDIYKLTLMDSRADGWSTGYFRILLEDNSLVQQGSLGVNEREKTFTISVGYVIAPLRTEWKYSASGSSIIGNWNTLGFDDSKWSTSSFAQLSTETTSQSITVYFRKTFELLSLDDYSSISFDISTPYGFIAYINGQEVFRRNIPDGVVNYNTYCTVQLSDNITTGSSVSILNGPVVSGLNIFSIELHKAQLPTSTLLLLDASLLINPTNNYRVVKGTAISDLENDLEVYKVFDNTQGSIYVSGPRCVGASPTWIYDNDRREYISSYSVTTGYKCNMRHPSDWKLEASNDGSIWQLLHYVRNYTFTEYASTVSFDFYNTKSYNQYRYVAIRCDNPRIKGADTVYENNCVLINEDQGFQLSDIALYSKKIEVSCQPQDGFSGAVENGYAYKDCAPYYSGRIEALCVNGQLTDSTSLCIIQSPKSITYNSPSNQLYVNEYFDTTPVVAAAEYTCNIIPDVPTGLVFDNSTARIYGTITTVMQSTSYTVNCKNTFGTTSTVIHISVIERPRTPIWVWIVLAIVIIVIIIIVVWCILNRCKPKASNGHAVLKSTKVTDKPVDKNTVPVTI